MIGHDRIRQLLESSPPAAALFVGPASVGKWTLAEHLRRHWGVDRADVIRAHTLPMESARDIADAVQFHPPSGRRLVIVRYDKASPDAMNVLLKSMEEFTDANHFILIGTELPAPTVVSRCAVFHFGPLSVDEVAAVLQERRFNPVEARKLAQASGGSVKAALAQADDSGNNHWKALAAFKIITEHDADALNTMALKWTDENTDVLTKLAREVVTERWGMFTADETEGLTKKTAMQILYALRPEVRPRLAVRSGLMGVLRGAQ